MFVQVQRIARRARLEGTTQKIVGQISPAANSVPVASMVQLKVSGKRPPPASSAKQATFVRLERAGTPSKEVAPLAHLIVFGGSIVTPAVAFAHPGGTARWNRNGFKTHRASFVKRATSVLGGRTDRRAQLAGTTTKQDSSTLWQVVKSAL